MLELCHLYGDFVMMCKILNNVGRIYNHKTVYFYQQCSLSEDALYE